MKKITLQLVFSLMMLFSSNIHAQDFNYNDNQEETTIELYNYVTKGLEIQIKSGLDMKRGYFLWDKMTRSVSSSDGKREVEVKALVLESNFKVVAWVMIYKNSEGKSKYFCLPTQISSEEVWNKCFADLRDTNLQTTAYLPLTWAMMNLIGQLTNDYDKVCFAKGSLVMTENYEYKPIEAITNNDTVIVFDSEKNELSKSKVKKLIIHDDNEYNIFKVTFSQKEEHYADNSISSIIINKKNEIKFIEATPNHPILTNSGIKRIDELSLGNEVFVINDLGETSIYTVSNIKKNYKKANSVYNLLLENGTTFIVNNIAVATK